MALYKYLHPDRIDVLENLQIRFTQPSALNDPFESLPMIEKIMEEDDFYKLLNNHVEENDLRNNVKAALEEGLSPYKGMIDIDFFQSEKFINAIMNNFEGLTRPYIKQALNPKNKSQQSYSLSFKKSFSNTFGVLSLTQNPDNLLMWSHYCDSYRGFLIEFDESTQFFDQQINEVDTIRKLKEVEYVSERPQISAFFDPLKVEQDDYMQELVKQFFLIKSDVWKYEMEMRMILPLEDSDAIIELPNGEKVYLFSIPPDLIKSVVFGSQMRNEVQYALSQILNQSRFNHVNIYLSELDLNNYKINIVGT